MSVVDEPFEGPDDMLPGLELCSAVAPDRITPGPCELPRKGCIASPGTFWPANGMWAEPAAGSRIIFNNLSNVSNHSLIGVSTPTEAIDEP